MNNLSLVTSGADQSVMIPGHDVVAWGIVSVCNPTGYLQIPQTENKPPVSMML
jgi:hypothetical protein